MGPHDLLCKWCSTFVGKDKNFCSIFCESRFTRSKRRKLAIKRPTQSGPYPQDTEYESPRTTKSAFTKKEQFLDDVISAMKIVSESPRSKNARLNGEQTPKETKEDDKMTSTKRTGIPKLDLTSSRKKVEAGSPRKASSDIPELLKSKTRTIVKHRSDSKLPIPSDSVTSSKDSNKKTDSKEKKDQPVTKHNTNAKQSGKPPDKTLQKQTDGKLNKSKDLSASNTENKEKAPEFGVPAPVTKTKSALDLEHRTRSSGYGAPVNPKLRPMSLKPKSASFILNSKRQSSASSVKSFKASTLKTVAESKSTKTETKLDSFREPSRSPAKSGGKWELVPKTIEEESKKTFKNILETSLEEEDPSPKSSQRNKAGDKSSDRSELKVLREESTASDFLDTSQIQDRLSSIKRKVEARRKGRDSRSSTGSDYESSFLDSSTDFTTERESKVIKSRTMSARLSARSNITRISKTFTPKREVK